LVLAEDGRAVDKLRSAATSRLSDVVQGLAEPFKLAAWLVHAQLQSTVLAVSLLGLIWIGTLAVGLIPIVGPVAALVSTLLAVSEAVIAIEIVTLSFVSDLRNVWRHFSLDQARESLQTGGTGAQPASGAAAGGSGPPTRPRQPAGSPEDVPSSIDRFAVTAIVAVVSLSFLLVVGISIPDTLAKMLPAQYGGAVWLVAELIVFAAVISPLILAVSRLKSQRLHP